jgi:hypothetical protein
MSGRFIKKIGQYEPDPADAPGFGIRDIAEVGTIRVEGEELVMLTPVDRWESFMDFDRNIVKLGYRDFSRPVMESDRLPEGLAATHVVVSGDEHTRIRTFGNPDPHPS